MFGAKQSRQNLSFAKTLESSQLSPSFIPTHSRLRSMPLFYLQSWEEHSPCVPTALAVGYLSSEATGILYDSLPGYRE